MFILGGSDIKDNFSRKTLFFSKYVRYFEKPNMIYPRAFFPSIFCLSDSCLYVFGGNDGITDINQCERFNVSDNAWNTIMPMSVKRNGCSCVAFDNVIFVFGGNNALSGSLDSIERYSVEFDKWSMPRVRLKEPLHDSVAFNLGSARVMIFGGSSRKKPNEYVDVYDLSLEVIGQKEFQMQTGKIYIPPVYDPSFGTIHTFLGYGDNDLVHASSKVDGLICSCRSVNFTDDAICPDDITGTAP